MKEVLELVQSELKAEIITSDEFESMTLADILARAKVSKASYQRALSISSTGIIVVLKRRPCEMMINNYNIEWIKAWDANMDLQICLDTLLPSRIQSYSKLVKLCKLQRCSTCI